MTFATSARKPITSPVQRRAQVPDPPITQKVEEPESPVQLHESPKTESQGEREEMTAKLEAITTRVDAIEAREKGLLDSIATLTAELEAVRGAMGAQALSSQLSSPPPEAPPVDGANDEAK